MNNFEKDVTIMRPDPPRFQTFQTSGGLAIRFNCDGGKHVWLSMRGQPAKGKCVCGQMERDAEPDSFALAIEELRMERRRLARRDAGIRDAMDQLRPDEPAYKRLALTLEDKSE